jgi:PAS domain S-box-containing protein
MELNPTEGFGAPASSDHEMPPRRRFRINPRSAFLCLLICLPLTRYAATAPVAKNILVLYSFSVRDVYDPVDSQEAAVRARLHVPVNFYVEYMESQRFDDPKYDHSLAANLLDTYRNVKIDLVIVVSYPALQFALQHREELFPGAPIVFRDTNPQRLIGHTMWPNVTGVTVHTDFKGTVDLALRLHPDTTTVAIVTGPSTFEQFHMAMVHRELLRYQGKVKEVDLVGLPTDQLLEAVAALPSHSIALFQVAPLDSVRMAVGVYDSVALIGERVPTYCIWPVLCLNHGGIGGAYNDEVEQSALTASLVARVLAGERPDDIPVVDGSPAYIRVDWHQLNHWKIPESALPPGSVVINRPLTFWQRDRKYIIPTVALIVAQALLIFGLLWQRARKRKAESVLRESEERFRVMADTTPSLVWMCDAQGKITYLNEQRLAFTGPDPNAGYGDTWITYIHPDDVKNVLNALWQALRDQKPFSKEYRLHRSDGTYRWMFDVASPRVNGDGSFAGFIGSAIDVTDQKLAQRALEQVSGQLIEAQEKERTRIARDLHDDICQRLALLSMELEQAKSVSKGRVAATKSLEEIRQHCSEIAGDVQSLSHQLHSSKLDFLGIVTAIRGFCKEFSKQNSVSVEFTDRQLPKHLPKDISLCLFRVSQEALHNAVKYSGTTRFTVELSATADEVQLQVTDAGAGFDLEQTKNRGLGLVSMQERVHQVHGKFSVESKPGKGTKIIAIVPLAAENRQVSEEGVAKDSASALERV